MAYDCWVNTRRDFTDMPDQYLSLVQNAEAAVWGQPHAEQNLRDASEHEAYVFLYRNRDGINAGGRATGGFGFDGPDTSDRHSRRMYLRLRDFVHGINLNTGVIRASVPPRELRRLINQRLFIGAAVRLSEENARRLYAECVRKFRGLRVELELLSARRQADFGGTLEGDRNRY